MDFEVPRFGIKVDFFNAGIGGRHKVQASERNREYGIENQLGALNAGFMNPLRIIAL